MKYKKIFLHELMLLIMITFLPLNLSAEVTANIQNGSFASVHQNKLYSVDGNTGKVTLLVTIPDTIGGVDTNASTSGVNSLAINTVDGLLYFVNNTASDNNTALFAYNMRTGVFSVLESDMSTRGVVFQGRGMGSGGAFFEPNDRRLYFGIEDDLAATPYDSYVYSIAVDATGVLSGNVSLELKFLMGWGDFSVSGNTLYSGHSTYNFSTSAWEDHYTVWNLGTLQSEGDETQTVDELQSFGQIGIDLGGNYYFVTGNTAIFAPIDLATGSQGTSKTMTLDGNTTLTVGSYDAAGIIPYDSSLGDKVWDDTNGNGILDNNESGVSNVTIELYNDINGNGIIDNGGAYNTTDRLLGIDTTDLNGFYKFTGLTPGTYLVKITDSNGILQNGRYTTTGRDTQVITITKALEFTDTADFGYTLPKDTDGDGVLDPDDLDDDNDGILDNQECVQYDWKFNVSAEGWGLELAGAAGGLPTGNIVGSMVHSSDAVTNIGGCSPSLYPQSSDGDFILANDPDNTWTWAISSDINSDVSNAFGGNLNFDYMDGSINGNAGVFTNVLRVVLIGKDANSTATFPQQYQNGWVNINIPLTEADWDANLSIALANLQKIAIEIEASNDIDTTDCTLTEYFGLDNISFKQASISCDVDLDGIPNHLDLDSDNDGIPDNIEGQLTSGYTAPSGVVDGNGTYSAIYGLTGIIPVNTDGNDSVDFLDLDSDNDGISDANESGLTLIGNVGINGLDNNVDTVDNYSDVNGQVDNPTSDLINGSGDSSEVAYRELTLVATNDSGATVNGLVGGTAISNVITNDTLNGVTGLTLGTDVNITTVTNTTPLSVNVGTGEVSVPANTPAGTYIETYTVCENLNPNNCEDANITVTVTAAPIAGIEDSNSSVNGSNGGIAIPNVTSNDTLNGNPVTLGVDANITSVTNNTPLVIDPTTGAVTVPVGTAAGTYTETYTLCENLNPSNCVDKNISITVNPAPIDAIDDDFILNPINGLVGGVVGDVTAVGNDTLNGLDIIDGKVTLTLTGDTNLSSVPTIENNGSLSIGSDTAAGTYYVEYQVCENLNPSNCDEANATLLVEPAAIIGTNDSNNSVNGLVGGTAISNVITNDTLNGVTGLTLGTDVNITTVTNTTPLSVNVGTGEVSVPANTPAGTYIETYTVCENLNPNNCEDANITVTVTAAPIAGIEDSNSSVNGSNGGIAIPNVTSNDTLNGNPVTLGVDANITSVTNNTPLVIDPTTGAVTVPVGTAAGTYTETYTLCENLNPSNCVDKNISITVNPAPIDAIDDDFILNPINGLVGGVVGDVTAVGNDTLNGLDIIDGKVTLTLTGDTNLSSVPTIENNGSLSIGSDTAAGTYYVEYQVCENLNPSNCDEANATLLVEPAAIIGTNDSNNSVNGLVGGTAISNVITNDTLNGVTGLTLGTDVNITTVTNTTPLSINVGTGEVSVPANTPAGTYTETYTVCENLNPSNCEDANITVVVDPAPIDAINDDFTSTPINGTLGGVAGDVTTASNDTLNGVVVIDTDMNLTIISDADTTLIGATLENNGSLSVPAGTPAGTYNVKYQICENLNPSNCDEANATLLVEPAVILGTNDSNNSVNGLVGGTAISNVITNDTLNGVTGLTLGTDVNITTVTNTTPLSINVGTGEVSVPANTPAGTYTETYTVCENLNPSNCEDANITVVVDPAPIDAINDDFTSTPINGTLGGVAGDVTTASNDTLNGVVVIDTDMNLTIISDADTTLIGATLENNGSLSVPAGTPAGTYNVKYQICENLNPSNCDEANATVVVLPDTDKDGILDIDDIDDDNDGIPDVVEANGDPLRDTDGDGVIDSLDLDSDNDGILDIVEANGIDSNNDGRVDDATDTDNDGLADIVDANPSTVDAPTDLMEGLSVTTLPVVDTDGDSVRDFQDVDSDNDGMSDLIEAGIPATNDSNNDGMIDNPTVDVDGIPTVTTPVATPMNTDGDSVPDYRDLDSDNDGLNDVVEAGGSDVDGNGLIDTPNTLVNPTAIPDSDNDGTLDPLEPNNSKLPIAIDANGDGIIDNTTDTDNDGIPDVTDGTPNTFATTPMLDSDNDGISDENDLDDDNDGISDTIEENGDPARDTDGDGIPDRLDLDSDNDGILDLLESGQDPAVVDTNNDGILDSTTDVDNDGLMDSADADDNDSTSVGTVTPIDTDGDTQPDFQDVDSDNDGLSDMVEAGIPADNDADSDGMIDDPAVNEHGIPTVVAPVAVPVDTDGDSVPNYRDLDSDNDGLTDVMEVDGLDENQDGIIDEAGALVDGSSIPDSDGNNVPNILEVNNPNLPVILDTNSDGIIDDATDSDNDGIPDATDGQDTVFGTAILLDSDGDGIADLYDIDDDNDGIPDTVENKGNPTRDTDEDGVIDSLDLDADNDGVLDIIEAGGVDNNNDGKVDNVTDSDRDGLADIVDASKNTASNPIDENAGRLVTLLVIPDTDTDGKDNFQDLDSDNDGLSDLLEAGVPVSNDDDNDGMIDGEVNLNGIPTLTTPIAHPLDSDNDGVEDYIELDSDNDGKKDIVEGGGTDEDNDGFINIVDSLLPITNLPDRDENGIPDYRQFDSLLLDDTVSGITIGQSATISILDNDELVGFDRDTLKIVDGANFVDLLVVEGEGNWSINENSEIVFTPEIGFELDPTDITYSLEDNNGNRDERATVNVNYLSLVRKDVKVTNLSEPVTVAVLDNDNGDLNVSTVEIVLPDGFVEAHPDAALSNDGKNLVVPNEGIWSVNSDGTITYRAEEGKEIVDPTPISYSVKDNGGTALSTDAIVTLRNTVVAGVGIETAEECATYKETSVDSFNAYGLGLLGLLATLFALYFIRKEKEV